STSGDEPEDGEPLAREFAEIDAVLARAGRTLAVVKSGPEEAGEGDLHALAAPWPLPASTSTADGFAEAGEAVLGAIMHDPERDEGQLLGQWLAAMRRIEGEGMPPVITAFLAWDEWEKLQPLERQHWLG